MIQDAWTQTTLGKIAEIIGGGTPSTDISDYWGGDIPWITPKDLSSHQNVGIKKGERSISKSGLVNSSARLLPKNSILFSSRAPIGYLAIAENELSTNQGFKSLICYDSICDYKFIYYWLKNNAKNIEKLAVGSTFAEVSGGLMSSISILLPPLPEQRAIADILSSLDVKIGFLREQNETLESTAQAIFQEWFGRYSVENPEELPEGWRVGKVSECMDIIGGGTPKTTIEAYWNGDIPWFSVVDCPSNSIFVIETEKHITKEGLENSSTKKLPIHTTIITARGTVGKLALTGVEMTMNQSCYGLRSNSNQHCYLFLLIQEVIEILKSRVHGAVFDTITRDTFTGIDTLIPTTELLNEFEGTVKPIFEKIYNNTLQVQSLSKTRDELLPRLMNGEVRLT